MTRVKSDYEYLVWFKQSATQLLKTNPSLLLTLFYLQLNLCGLMYLVILFDEFSLSVTKYLELSDYMMAFFASPGISFAIAIFIVFCLSVSYFIQYILKRDLFSKVEMRGLKSWMFSLRVFYPLHPMLSLYLIVLTIIPLLYSWDLATLDAYNFKQNKGTHYDVDLVNTVGLKEDTLRYNQVQLLAESERFVFLYHHATQQSIVLTRDNIASIQLSKHRLDN